MALPGVPAQETRVVSEPLHIIGRSPKFWKGSIESLQEVFAHRELLGLLINRELRARYKDSSLGFVWSLMRPLFQLLIYYVAIGHFLGAAKNIPDFAIYVFTGLSLWSLFSEIITAGTASVVSNSGLVKKIYLPREIFPLSAVGGSLVNFAIQFGILVVATIALGRFPWHIELLYFPAAVLLVVTFTTALALLLSALNVYLRDIQHLVEIMLLVLFWASPIVYSFSMVHKVLMGNWVEQLYLANPVTMAVLGLQRAMWISGSGAGSTQYWPPNLPLSMLIAFVVSIVLLFVCQRIFSRLQANFAQEL